MLLATKNIDEKEKFSNENVLALPFPNKLWVLASLARVTCITWNIHGNSIYVDLKGLTEYLSSEKSMFHESDVYEFLMSLTDHGFQAVDNINQEDFLETRHKFFTRDRVEYLYLISNENATRKPDPKTIERSKFDASFRMQGDTCYKKYAAITPLEMNRAKFKATLNFKISDAKLKNCLAQQTTNGVALPIKTYKNTAENVIMIERGTQKYAGYYGEKDNEMLGNFFGEYKPSYVYPEHPGTEQKYYASKPSLNIERLQPNNAGSSKENFVKQEDKKKFYEKQITKWAQFKNELMQSEQIIEAKVDDQSLIEKNAELNSSMNQQEEVFEDDDELIEPIEDEEHFEQNNYEMDLMEIQLNEDEEDPGRLEIDINYDEIDSEDIDENDLPDLNYFCRDVTEEEKQVDEFPTSSKFYTDSG